MTSSWYKYIKQKQFSQHIFTKLFMFFKVIFTTILPLLFLP